MTKASSRHSSATASPKAPRTGDGGNGGDSLMVEGEQMRKSPPRIPQNGFTSANNSSSTKSDAQNAIDAPTVESQPEKSSSNSSNPPTKETEGGDHGAEVQYGTRSRNRAGKLRPNYAEDNGMDAEFEVVPAGKEKPGRKAVQAAEAASSNGPDAGKSVIPALTPESEQQAAQSHHHKDPIPGTSTFSAHPAPAPQTKKRKAASQNAAAAAQASSNNGPPAVTRKASMAAQVAAGARETNMLTFENCGGRLQDNKLVADDGTVLGVNGKLDFRILLSKSKNTPKTDKMYRSCIPHL